MTYKILDNVIAATISEARNAPANTATIVSAGTVDVERGEIIVITHEQSGKRALYPLQAVKVDFENGNTTIAARSLLSQLFNCILPDMADQTGEASVIIKAALTALNAQHFADIYINDDNFVASSRTYATVNVSHRKVGELFQDLCKDTQFVMWVGYDEINDKMNAFFFKPVSIITQDLGAVKEGSNIVSETVQLGTLDDICNYVLMYYFPKRYPYGEEWTEPAYIEEGTSARTWYADYATQAKLSGATREVRLFQAGPVTHLSSDCINENHLHVSDTTGFAAAGLLLIDGYAVVSYVSKTATTFVLPGAINGKWTDGAIVCQSWMSDGGYAATCEAVSVMMAPITTTIDQLDFYVGSIVGTPSPIKVYVVSSEYGQPLQLIGTITPTVGWNTLSFDPPVIFGAGTFYTFRIVFIITTPATVNDYYTLGMGPAAVGDFWNWSAFGSEVWGSVADNLQMLSLGMFSGLMTAPNTTWVCTGTVLALDQAAFLSAGGMVLNDNRAGKGCIRFIGAGTAKVVDNVDISEYDRIHFFHKGNVSQIEIECVGGSYFQALGSESDWQEETLTLSAMLTSGTPIPTLIDIKFTMTGGSSWVDGLYFLAPSSGLPVIVQDNASILVYGQHPEVIYATGVTESSYAYALAQAIIADKKIPKYTGSIVVKDVPTRWTPQKSVRVVIPSKGIDEVMDIFQVTHTMDGLATLEVNSFEFDYARVLAGLESGVENLQISFGATPRVDENVALQVPTSPSHAARHSHGGTDEINVGGLNGVLADNQPTTWGLVALKPSSPVADIDNAVSLRHAATHSHPESEVTNLVADLAAKVPKTLFDAYSILAATTDDTPAALTVAEQTLLGRITGGVIAALSIAQIRTLLSITAAGAELINDADAAAQRATLGAIATGDSRLSDARVALDVYAWAKAANPPAIGPFISEINRSDGNDYSLAARTQGIYAIAGAGSNGPGPTYLNLIHAANHTDVAFQIAGGYLSDAMYFRGTSALQNGTEYTPWRTVLHDGNIGSYAVVGPASATDNAIVRFDAATGKLVQDSSAIIDDNGEAIIKGFPVTLFLAALARHGVLTNLITNGDFETDTTEWGVAGATITRDTATPLVGAGSLKVTPTAVTGYAYSNTARVNGHVYFLSCHAKSTAGAPRVFRINVVGGSASAWIDVSTETVATIVWTNTNATSPNSILFQFDGYASGSFLLDSVVCYDLTA